MEPDAIEIRVVGCLVEKQRTTPDAYPLSLNALRLACNQSTNRDPVVDYDEATVAEALRRLALRGWTRLASGAGSRARKYRHLMPEALGIDDAELSLLAVLMLRGEQTPGELKQRSERLHGFTDLAAAEASLQTLVERGYVVRHARRPGQKEERYQQLLGGLGEEGASPAMVESDSADPDAGAQQEKATGEPELIPAEDRLTRLERELAALRSELASLREALGEDSGESEDGDATAAGDGGD
ncbi:MAG TPA: YceH family protein [Solirubrobacterales bacterium]|nr:YceH family protein [Solirubrobacterales bacterium]